MAYYLQMDGVDDLLRSPQLTVTRVVIDFVYEDNNPPATTAYYLWDNRTGTPAGNYYLSVSTTNTLSKGSNVTTVLLDGVTVGSVTLTPSTRYVIDSTMAAVLSNANGIEFFVNYLNQNTTRTKGKIYNIKLYNDTTLLVHYDCTLGNVQDQSGNGNHGTLTGGTWVSESSGTTHEGASSVTGVSTITASATLIPAAITGSASLQGVSTVSATADVVNAPMVGSASLQGVGTATATASVIRSGSANIMGVSTLTASAAGLAVLGGASLTGVGWVMCSAIEGQFIVSVVNLEFEVLRTVQLESSIERVVNLEALLTRIVALEGEL